MADVYRSGVERPAEALSALHEENARLRREVAYITETGEKWRRLWEQVDGERSRECIRADQAEAAVARVRAAHPRVDDDVDGAVCGGCGTSHVFVFWPCQVIRDLDGLAAVSEEHTGGGNG